MDLSRILTAFIVPIAVTALMLVMQRQSKADAPKDRSDKAVTLRVPRVVAWVGYVCLGFFGVLSVVSVILAETVVTAILCGVFFGAFTLLGVFCVHAQRVYAVTLPRGADHLLYRTVLGNRYTVAYADCIDYKHKGSDLILRAVATRPDGKRVKKTFIVDAMSTNFAELLATLMGQGVKERH